MYPWLIEDPFRVGTYGVMAFVAYMVGYILFQKDLRRRPEFLNGMRPQQIADVTLLISVLGGVFGSKLAFMLFEAPQFNISDLFMDSGLTWYGGLILNITLLIIWWHRRGLNVGVMADLMAPIMAIGYGFGRIGCQLAGDGDFGVPCVPENIDAALCMTYPNGLVPSPCYTGGIEYAVCPGDAINPFFFPVHPTPLYEAAGAFMLFGLLWFLRTRITRTGVLLSIYMMIAGALRFLVELIRVSEMRPERFLGLRDAQIIALAQVLAGLVILLWAYGKQKDGDLKSLR